MLQQPYIPGSAVKGALRTAYLNAMARKKNPAKPDGKRAAMHLERTLLNYDSIPGDPFRLVRVSDFMPMGQANTRILYGVNEKKIPSKYEARGPYQILEVIESGAVFSGEISVETPQKGSGIKEEVSAEELFSSAAQFYSNEKLREDSELKQIGVTAFAPVSDNNICFIRMGRHSGAESITVEGYRSIKIMKGKGEKPVFEDHATTLWLASEIRDPKFSKQMLRPFGWAELSETMPESGTGQDGEKEPETMTVEEKMIADLNNPSVVENRVLEICNKIDTVGDEYKPDLAKALRTYWQKHDKWEKKKCSNKQWKRVRKVKEILGE